MEDVLDTLNLRERRVLQLRFGLEDGRSRTLEEVGKEFGVTRERIRQIEAKALRKLRHPSRSKKLRGFPGVVRGDPVSPERDSSHECTALAFETLKNSPRFVIGPVVILL